MTDEHNNQLAQLVNYLLVSEDWKKVYLSEVSEPIRLFMFKTGLPFRRTMLYVDKALNKLIGPVYTQTQKQLYYKYHCTTDLYLKPKTYTQKKKEQNQKEPKKPHSHKGKTLAPRSEFGKLYVAHYGYGAGINKDQYDTERRFYMKFGRPSWDVEK